MALLDNTPLLSNDNEMPRASLHPGSLFSPDLQRFTALSTPEGHPKEYPNGEIDPSPIPQRLIFTYRTNLMETKDPKLFYDNVVKTVAKYQELWPDAEVYFLDDAKCRESIGAKEDVEANNPNREDPPGGVASNAGVLEPFPPTPPTP